VDTPFIKISILEEEYLHTTCDGVPVGISEDKDVVVLPFDLLKFKCGVAAVPSYCKNTSNGNWDSAVMSFKGYDVVGSVVGLSIDVFEVDLPIICRVVGSSKRKGSIQNSIEKSSPELKLNLPSWYIFTSEVRPLKSMFVRVLVVSVELK